MNGDIADWIDIESNGIMNQMESGLCNIESILENLNRALLKRSCPHSDGAQQAQTSSSPSLPVLPVSPVLPVTKCPHLGQLSTCTRPRSLSALLLLGLLATPSRQLPPFSPRVISNRRSHTQGESADFAIIKSLFFTQSASTFNWTWWTWTPYGSRTKTWPDATTIWPPYCTRLFILRTTERPTEVSNSCWNKTTPAPHQQQTSELLVWGTTCY